MIVCICHRISDRDIARAARQGCTSFDELQDQTRVGTACGACGDCARETFEAQQCQQHSPPLTVAVSWMGRGAARAPSLAAAPQPAGMG
jgi:bacterioferritin-associated ferredoxin